MSEFLKSSTHPKLHFPKILLTSKVDNPGLTRLSLQTSHLQTLHPTSHWNVFTGKLPSYFLLGNRCDGWSRGPPEAEHPCIPLITFPIGQRCDSIMEMRLDSSSDNLEDKEGVDKIQGQSPHTQFLGTDTRICAQMGIPTAIPIWAPSLNWFGDSQRTWIPPKSMESSRE